MVRFFSGHVIPGTLFIMLAVRWSIATAYAYAKKKSAYRSTVTMRLPCKFMRLQHELVETLVKLCGGVYGVVIHILEADEAMTNAARGIVDYHGAFGDELSIVYRTKHHTVIYSAFLVSSLVELLVYLDVRLPDKCDRAMLIVTFGLEGFMFMFHLHARSQVDVQLHLLQTVSIFATVLFCVLEVIDDRQVLFTYGRIVFVALQGTWFYQTAFALYYPLEWPPFKWDIDDPKLSAEVTFYFCVHFILILAALVGFHLFMQFFIARFCSQDRENKAKQKINCLATVQLKSQFD